MITLFRDPCDNGAQGLPRCGECPSCQPVDSSVSPDAFLSEEELKQIRRQEPIYKAIQRAETFLHILMEDDKYKEEAGSIHGELHEAAYLYVTKQ